MYSVKVQQGQSLSTHKQALAGITAAALDVIRNAPKERYHGFTVRVEERQINCRKTCSKSCTSALTLLINLKG